MFPGFDMAVNRRVTNTKANVCYIFLNSDTHVQCHIQADYVTKLIELADQTKWKLPILFLNRKLLSIDFEYTKRKDIKSVKRFDLQEFKT